MHTVSELLLARAADRPDAELLRFEDETVTFAEAFGRARVAAARLAALGVREGDRVALMLAHRPEHVDCFLGLAWLGATLVPVSIHLKADGLAVQMRDAAPALLVADPRLAAEVTTALAALESPPRLAWFAAAPAGDSMTPVLAPATDPSVSVPLPPAAPVDPERLICISYTSGTTGAPKGVMLTERWFWMGAGYAADLCDLEADDVLLMWEPFFHISGWMTVLACLQRGARMAMVERFSASRCWDQVRAFGVTKLHYLGGMLNLLLAQPARADDADNPVTIAWGAAAPAAAWREFEQRFGCTIRECYGLSEASNMNLANFDGPPGSIGRPLPPWEAWIVREDGTPAPPGVVGEIVLRSREPGVAMRGYFGRPEATAEVLRDGCVWTGDLGRCDAQGWFWFAGRKKDAMRRRGENVSAWEVERVLNAHPAVEESAVIGVPSGLGEDDIKAFVRPVDGVFVDPLDLVRWCDARLAYYQVPRWYTFVDAFPRTPSERIRKGELPRDTAGCFDLEASGYVLSRGDRGS